MIKLIEPGKRKGAIVIPPSKSDAQRAILIAGLAEGKSELQNVGRSDDERTMLQFIQQIGAEVRLNHDTKLHIIGTGNIPDNLNINTGESGLASRLITCILAVHDGNYKITGEGTLLNRSMHFFQDFFNNSGLDFQSENGYLPFHLNGKIHAGTYQVDGSQSSQYLSGLLMALPLLEGDSLLEVNNLRSIPYIRLTIQSLLNAGIHLEYNETFSNFKLPGNQCYKPINYTVEGDWSAASYWLIGSALGLEISVSGLSMGSLQADKNILNALIAAGCSVTQTPEGIAIDGSKRHCFEFDAIHCPDLFPALVTFAALTAGTSVLRGAERLRYKESDRATVLKTEFEKLGVIITIHGDEMRVTGKKFISGGNVDSHHDHRIAMCLAIAGLFSTESITIDHAESVAKSYPNFWKDLERLERLV
jgi:3-phosphoshikimate 1-carboxyvinyltransferase